MVWASYAQSGSIGGLLPTSTEENSDMARHVATGRRRPEGSLQCLRFDTASDTSSLTATISSRVAGVRL